MSRGVRLLLLMQTLTGWAEIATTVTTPVPTPTPTTPTTPVRLVNSDNSCSGRVEVFLNGQWQTVCDKGWGMNNARVVCQQLGCGRSVSIPKKAHFGQGSGPISEYHLQCSGQESSIADCKQKELGSDKCGHEDDAGVVCEEIATTVTTPVPTPTPTTPTTPVRLVNSDNSCSGRVEVFLNGQWQTVCDKGWGMNNARVVCQQLGCGRSVSMPKKAHFGQGSGPISEYHLQCSGQESSIADCKQKELGSDKCGHEDDAGVVCEEIATTVTTPVPTPTPTTPTTPVRLVNSDNSCSGRVEVFLNGQWQTVCDKGWGMNNARVVCQQLGCGRSVSIPKKAHFGQGSGPISEYHLQCSGQESSIADCKQKELGSDKCGHEDDAGVVCEEIATTVTTPVPTPTPTTPTTPVRLVNSDNSCSGRVEVFLNGQWQTVCDKGWGMNNARVVCQQLGCGRSVSIPKKAHFGQGSGPISEYHLQCSGQESSIADCKQKELGSDKCGHEDDAGVVCEDIGTTIATPATTPAPTTPTQTTPAPITPAPTTPAPTTPPPTIPAPTTPTPTTSAPTTPSTSVRLVNSNKPCAGRVEIFLNGLWGTVCDNGWGMNDAQVVCQQLGCGKAVSAPRSAYFGKGSGPIWVTNLRCSGSESSIKDCPSNKLKKFKDCEHEDDASVICEDKQTLKQTIQLVCSRNHLKVGVSLDSLRSSGFNPFSGQLGVPYCSSYRVHGNTVWYHVLYWNDICGNVLKTNKTHAIYSNNFFLYPQSNSPIVQPEVIPISCAYPLQTNTNLEAVIRPQLLQKGGLKGSGPKTKANIQLFCDSDYAYGYPGCQVTLQVGSPLYVGVFVAESDPSFTVVLEHCYATKSSKPDDPKRYFIIHNRCPADQQHVTVVENGVSHCARFSALLFPFQGDDSSIFLHCKIRLCDKRNENCIPFCRKRTYHCVSNTPDLDTLTIGPITL